MVRTSFAAGILGIAILLASPAWADTETVHLADGSVFAGDLVEKVPGDHVTIKLATGEVRRFEWSAIAPSALVAATPATPTTTTQVAVVQQFPTLPTRTSHVQLTSDTRGTLLVRVDTMPVGPAGWPQSRESPVCYAPCSADVDANASYYVSGYSITQSSRFAVPEGNAALTVHTGSAGLTIAGAWLIGTGTLALITGAIATPIAFAESKSSAIDGWEEFGLSALIGGAVFILVGIPFIVAGRTRVSMGEIDIAKAKVRPLPNGFSF